MSEERELTMGAAVREALHHEIERDSTVVVMGFVHLYAGLVGKYGRIRVRDTPVSEAGFIGAAIGAAATGLRPVAALNCVDFFGIPMDQISIRGPKSVTCLVVRLKFLWLSVQQSGVGLMQPHNTLSASTLSSPISQA